MESQFFTDPDPVAVDDPPRHSILIVEDDASMAEVLSIRLERQGYHALRAHTGRSGLEMARTHRPHLVLVDIRLPDVDGLNVCQALDEDPGTSSIPKIVLSGMERPDIIRRSRAAGCQFYVRKPYDPNALLILIQQAISETDGDA